MTNEQKLREFADKWGIREDDEPTFDPHTENPYYGYSRRTKQCLSDLTALISEHYYPKEFVVWKDANCTYLRGSGHYAINDYPKTVYGDYVPYTLDELFNYWANNEK